MIAFSNRANARLPSMLRNRIEPGSSLDEPTVELEQVLGPHAQVAVQDHQHVVLRLREAGPDGVALAPAALQDQADVAGRMRLDLAEDLAARVVGRMALDEDQL